MRKANIERSKQNRDKIVDKNRAEASARATAHPTGNRIVNYNLKYRIINHLLSYGNKIKFTVNFSVF